MSETLIANRLRHAISIAFMVTTGQLVSAAGGAQSETLPVVTAVDADKVELAAIPPSLEVSRIEKRSTAYDQEELDADVSSVIGQSGWTPAVTPMFYDPQVIQAQATEPAPPTQTDFFGLVGRTFGQSSVSDFLGSSLGVTLTRIASDAGSLLVNQVGVTVHQRTPIVTDNALQGRRIGQTTANGSYWFPARQDLDTMLSKIDSRLVRDIVSIKGPYSALYGPGLSFYDVVLLEAPRYQCGFEAHSSSVLEYQTNGQQWHARQSVWGGSYDWGFRIGYGHRTGSDYETGADFELPSSYKSRIPDVTFGADITENHHVDFHYLRLDQTDVEFPGQVYDFNFLVTESYELKYVWDMPVVFDRLELETWINRTRFDGDNLRAGKRRQIPELDQFAQDPFFGLDGRFLSFTNVNAESSGLRLAFTRGLTEEAQITVGTDLRHLQQQITEKNQIDFPSPAFDQTLSDTILPPAHSTNPGIFVETNVELTERLRIKAGSRVDWVNSNAESSVDLDNDNNPEDLEFGPTFGLLGLFDRQFDLWSAFSTFEYDIDSNWTFLGGFGHGMRAPTMTELYAVEPFVAVLPQLILTKLRGNPNLRQEKMWQVDIGVEGDFDYVRGGVNGFYSWVEDYVTFENIVDPSISGIVFSFVNTDLATLSGGEAFLECDVTSTLTAFANVSFVEGRDRSRNQNVSPKSPHANNMRGGSSLEREPLPVIAPFEGRVGFRLRSPEEDGRWRIEFSSRIVDAQDRVATLLREEQTPGFALFDVNAYWQALDDLLITIGINNLSDKFYQEHFDTRNFAETFQPGQNFYIGLEVTR